LSFKSYESYLQGIDKTTTMGSGEETIKEDVIKYELPDG
jgi:hypothetical protein